MLKQENLFKINGGLISIAEQENDPSRKIAKFLLCPLDEPNANGKGIKKSDLSQEQMDTLIGQPLVTKVIYNEQTKQYDFSGHLMKKVWKYDESGNLVKFSDFTSTSPIGYHTAVSIEDIDFNGVTKPCLIAEVTLWTRYYRAMEVIERLGTNLHTSWELSYGSSYKEDGTDWLKNILFLANCALGTGVNPAYKIAGLLEEVAEEQEENDELSEALICDLKEINEINDEDEEVNIEKSSDEFQEENNDSSIETENNSVENKLNNDLEEKGGIVDMAENKVKAEVSSVTTNDLYNKLSVAINAIDTNRWICISRVYPYEFRVVGYDWNAETDDDYIEFKYVVNSDESISIISETPVKMTFVPSVQIDNQIQEIQIQLDGVNDELSTKKTELSTKLDEIVTLGESIQSLKDQLAEKETIISELEPLRIEKAEAEAKKAEEEKAEKKKCLSEMLVSSKYFTQDEVDTSEAIQDAIANLDEPKVKSILAEKVLEEAQKIKDETTEDAKKKEKTEVSEVEISTDINANQEYEYKNPASALLNYARRNIKK
jgi:hypothetical protein